MIRRSNSLLRFVLPHAGGALLAGVLAIGSAAQSPLPNHRMQNFPLISGAGGYGTHAVALRDHDGDGYEDYAVAAPNASVPAGAVGPGVVYVHSGRTGEVLKTFVGDQTASRFGEAIADCGDLDGDAVPDLVVSAIDHDAGSINGGRLYAFSGADGSLLWDKDGVDSANLGKSVVTVGDVTGDGVVDFLVGESRYSIGLLGRGRVLLVEGSAGGTFATGDGPNAFSDLGVVAVATPAGGVFVGDAMGRVFTVGPPASGTLQLTLTYDRPAGANGPAELAAITGPGGVSRLLIGRRLADSNGLINNGRVELFEGGLSLLTIEGSQFAAQVGTRVAATRDVDGDGVDEILYVEYGGSPLQPDPVTIVRQDGTVVDSFLVDAASTGRPFAIADTTGDGRGEWGIGLFNGGFGLAECRLHARGLADPVLSQPGGASRVDYSFDLSPLRAGAVYWQLYSLSGSSPGIALDPAWPRLPLQLDPFTNLFFVQSNTATFPGAIGNLDGAGRGTSSLVFAPALAVLASGWEVTSCVVVFGAGGWPPVAVSNPRLVVLP